MYTIAQRNLEGIILVYWFINVREIVSLISENGYSLIFKSDLKREYNQENFPAEYQLKQACNLLLKRAGNE